MYDIFQQLTAQNVTVCVAITNSVQLYDCVNQH